MGFFSFVPISLSPLIWILLDVISSYALFVIAGYQANRADTWDELESDDDRMVCDDLAKDRPSEERQLEVDASIPPKAAINPTHAVLYFLLNPYTILTCIGLSTQSFSTSLTLASIALATKNKQTLSLLLMSVSAYLTVPFMSCD